MTSRTAADPTPSIPFRVLADTSQRLAATRSRLEKRRLLVELLARVTEGEIGAVVGWLVAEPRCGPLGVGPALLWQLSATDAPEAASVSVVTVEAALEEAGRADHAARLAVVANLFARLTTPERALVVGALTGSLRQGAWVA